MSFPDNYPDRYQVRTEHFISPLTGKLEASYAVFDSVTSQRRVRHDLLATAQRECDLRNTDWCHALATNYAAVPVFNSDFLGSYSIVIETMRAVEEQDMGHLSKRPLGSLDAALLAEYANRTQPDWDEPLDSVLDRMRSERLNVIIDAGTWQEALDAAGLPLTSWNHRAHHGTYALSVQSTDMESLFTFVGHLTAVIATEEFGGIYNAGSWEDFGTILKEHMSYQAHPEGKHVLIFPGVTLV